VPSSPASEELSHRMPEAPQTVLITGASSGIGRATARELARRGARLVLVARGEEALEDTAEQVGTAGAAEVLVCPADVLDEDAITGAVAAAVERFGRLDAVVHAAQVLAYGTVEEVPRKVFETVVETAVHGTAVVARAVLRVFRQQGEGRLVVVNSVLGQVATPLMGSYVAAKWGQLGLVRVLQQETRDVPGIAISILQPGGVDTPIYFQAASWVGSTGRPPPPVYSPERLGRRIVALLDRPRRQVQAGILNPLITAAFRLVPGVFDALVGPMTQRLAIADEDVPPTEGNVFESRPAGNATEGRWRGI
jgi:NAD(P)-dependent dehydrogenase (short-subunit alcohol dehydrogenase family)